MRRYLTALCLCLLSAPALAAPPAAAPTLSPAQQAAQDMMTLFEDLCLDHFPNPEAFGSDLAGRKAVPLDAATTKQVLMGHPGTAWTVAGTLGSYTVAMEMPPALRCVVTGRAAEDDGVQAVFNLLITNFAKSHDLGEVQSSSSQGEVGGAPASLQLLAISGRGAAHQAFVNMGVAGKDGSFQLRLAREFAPK